MFLTHSITDFLHFVNLFVNHYVNLYVNRCVYLYIYIE